MHTGYNVKLAEGGCQADCQDVEVLLEIWASTQTYWQDEAASSDVDIASVEVIFSWHDVVVWLPLVSDVPSGDVGTSLDA